MRQLAAAIAFLVVAFPNGAISALLRPRITEAASRQMLTNYVQAWSSDNAVTAQAMNDFYADRVIYYGKPMSRNEVFQDKLHYIATWTERRYAIVPRSTSVVCGDGGAFCQVRGLMRWDRRSKVGARSTGTAYLTLMLGRDSGDKIVRESAVIKEQL